MELSKLAEDLYMQLENELENLENNLGPGVIKLSESLHVITRYLNRLRKFIKENGFENEAEEIECFKILYPRFYCWYVYITEVFNITTNIPTGTEATIREYYLQEIASLKRYLNQNQFAYQYYIHDETALDRDYFLRKNFVPFRQGFGIAPVDEEFTTNMGYSFARFIASDKLQDFLVKRVKLSYHESLDPLVLQFLNDGKRQWTGEKINLIELAYGIFYTGQMNNGKADLKDVLGWLESSLNVDLSQAYRMFLDIRRRKTTSYTKFLEQMSFNIQKHVEESFNYKPQNNFK